MQFPTRRRRVIGCLRSLSLSLSFSLSLSLLSLSSVMLTQSEARIRSVSPSSLRSTREERSRSSIYLLAPSLSRILPPGIRRASTVMGRVETRIRYVAYAQKIADIRAPSIPDTAIHEVRLSNVLGLEDHGDHTHIRSRIRCACGLFEAEGRDRERADERSRGRKKE